MDEIDEILKAWKNTMGLKLNRERVKENLEMIEAWSKAPAYKKQNKIDWLLT